MTPTDMADDVEGFKKGTSYFSITIISTTLGVIKNILNTTSAIESLMKGHQITKIPNQNDR
jgi:energy-converting hydrogenase Eha subunit F